MKVAEMTFIKRIEMRERHGEIHAFLISNSDIFRKMLVQPVFYLKNLNKKGESEVSWGV